MSDLDRNIKFLGILNENDIGDSADVYRALEELSRVGIMDSYKVYPFLARFEDNLSNDEVLDEILTISEEYQPQVILWFHADILKVPKTVVEKLRGLNSRPVMGYWDGDIFKNPYNPLPKNIFDLVVNCDVSFWQGQIPIFKKFKSMGHKDIRYTPAATDEVRFGALREKDPVFDVVMVANFFSSRLPWRNFPGIRWRVKIAKYFYKKLGKRFAVFGNKWKGPFACGPVTFKEQTSINHKSRIVLGVNTSNCDYYFSNRMPICMSSGVPIVNNYQKGFDEIFRDIDYPYFFKTTEEAWIIARNLLDKSQSELDEIGSRTRDFALAHLSKYKILKYMIDVLCDHKLSQETNKPLHIRPNPWISLPRF